MQICREKAINKFTRFGSHIFFIFFNLRFQIAFKGCGDSVVLPFIYFCFWPERILLKRERGRMWHLTSYHVWYYTITSKISLDKAYVPVSFFFKAKRPKVTCHQRWQDVWKSEPWTDCCLAPTLSRTHKRPTLTYFPGQYTCSPSKHMCPKQGTFVLLSSSRTSFPH